jgi:hypothetical protein
LENRKAALVRYSLNGEPDPGSDSPITEDAWGPFPFRIPEGEEKGSICFPAFSSGGWVYRDEYLAGERLFPEVQFEEAWVYEAHCDCRPFAKIPEYYLYRLKIGKEGRGITIKLGVNSCYGKLAQSIGNAVFNSWLWAGMITSGCRAQALDMLALHKDWRNMLMIATDGIATRERLVPPVPLDTGTFRTLDGTVNTKPLGGWEWKGMPQGMFFARPGIYFPLHLGLGLAGQDEETLKKTIKDIKGRGVGKAVLVRHYEDILRAWVMTKGAEKLTVTRVERFCGSKTSIHRSGAPGHYTFTRADGTQESVHGQPPAYGQWISRPVEMSFDPLPKRDRIDGKRLPLRRMRKDWTSLPYDPAVQSREARELKAFADQVQEQSDVSFEELEGMFSEEGML